jgi:hypothetical protein
MCLCEGGDSDYHLRIIKSSQAHTLMCGLHVSIYMPGYTSLQQVQVGHDNTGCVGHDLVSS